MKGLHLGLTLAFSLLLSLADSHADGGWVLWVHQQTTDKTAGEKVRSVDVWNLGYAFEVLASCKLDSIRLAGNFMKDQAYQPVIGKPVEHSSGISFQFLRVYDEKEKEAAKNAFLEAFIESYMKTTGRYPTPEQYRTKVLDAVLEERSGTISVLCYPAAFDPRPREAK